MHVNEEDEREFDYERGGPIGPERWGEIKNEWRLCSYGTMQSPIDMSNRRVEKLVNSYNMYRKYKPSNATLNNRGHDISVILIYNIVTKCYIINFITHNITRGVKEYLNSVV